MNNIYQVGCTEGGVGGVFDVGSRNKTEEGRLSSISSNL